MAKSWKKSAPRRSRGTQAQQHYRRTDSSLEMPDSTFPDSLIPRSALWISSDATSEEPIAETASSRKFSQTPYELAEKYMAGGVQFNPRNVIVFVLLIWLAFTGFLFIQDNSGGKFETIAGYLVFLRKVGFITLLSLIGSAAIWFVLKFKTKRDEG